MPNQTQSGPWEDYALDDDALARETTARWVTQRTPSDGPWADYAPTESPGLLSSLWEGTKDIAQQYVVEPLVRRYKFARDYGSALVSPEAIRELKPEGPVEYLLPLLNVIQQMRTARDVMQERHLGQVARGDLPPEEVPRIHAGAVDLALDIAPLGRLLGPPIKAAGRAAGEAVAQAALKLGASPRAAGLAAGAAALGARAVPESMRLGFRYPSTEDPTTSGRLREAGVLGAIAPAFAPLSLLGSRVVTPFMRRLHERMLPMSSEATFERIAREARKQAMRELPTDAPNELLSQAINRVHQKARNLTAETIEALGPVGELLMKELPTIVRTGTFSQANKLRAAALAREAGITQPVSRQALDLTLSKLAILRGYVDALAGQARLKGDAAVATRLKDAAESFSKIGKEYFLAMRREAGRSLRWFQEPHNLVQLKLALQELGIMTDALGTIRISSEELSAWQKFLRTFTPAGAGKRVQGLRAGLLLARINLFTPLSWAADTITNATYAAGDLISSGFATMAQRMLRGEAPAAGARLRAAWRTLKNFKASLPQDRILAPGLFGEHIGVLYGQRADRILAAFAKFKSAVDQRFSRYGFYVGLYEKALTEASRQQLRGPAKQEFIERFLLSPPQDALQSAVELANKFAFRRPLGEFGTAAAQSALMQLLVTPFPRFTTQMLLWLTEMSPLNLGFWNKALKGQASGVDFARFAAQALTGIGAVDFVNQTIYDRVDFNTMEYVREDGRRVGLFGVSPLNEALFVAAVGRGEYDKALAAARSGALGFLTFEGLIMPVIDRLQHRAGGQAILERLEDQFTRMIPGQAMLRAITSLMFDPPATKGVLGIIGAGRPIIDPLTGEDMRQKRELIGTQLPVPDIGTRGTQRVLSPTERMMRELGFVRLMPRIPKLIDPETGQAYDDLSDIPRERREAYERLRGYWMAQLLDPLAESADFRRKPPEVQRRVIRQRMAKATELARRTINVRARKGQ